VSAGRVRQSATSWQPGAEVMLLLLYSPARSNACARLQAPPARHSSPSPLLQPLPPPGALWVPTRVPAEQAVAEGPFLHGLVEDCVVPKHHHIKLAVPQQALHNVVHLLRPSLLVHGCRWSKKRRRDGSVSKERREGEVEQADGRGAGEGRGPLPVPAAGAAAAAPNLQGTPQLRHPATQHPPQMPMMILGRPSSRRLSKGAEELRRMPAVAPEVMEGRSSPNSCCTAGVRVSRCAIFARRDISACVWEWARRTLTWLPEGASLAGVPPPGTPLPSPADAPAGSGGALWPSDMGAAASGVYRSVHSPHRLPCCGNPAGRSRGLGDCSTQLCCRLAGALYCSRRTGAARPAELALATARK
jgi:hypothetical protein